MWQHALSFWRKLLYQQAIVNLNATQNAAEVGPAQHMDDKGLTLPTHVVKHTPRSQPRVTILI